MASKATEAATDAYAELFIAADRNLRSMARQGGGNIRPTQKRGRIGAPRMVTPQSLDAICERRTGCERKAQLALRA